MKTLTDFSYVLGAGDLAAGRILACQSVPTDDCVIAVDLVGGEGRARGLRGVIEARTLASPAVMILDVRLPQPLKFTAGQTAQLTNEEGVTRPYSFAEPPAPEGSEVVRFHIRREPAGRFTGWLFERATTGAAIDLLAPLGRFRHQPSGRSAIYVAGGTGFAPLHAILADAATQAATPSACLIVASRSEAELYARTDALQAAWGERLEVIRAVSHDAPAQADIRFAYADAVLNAVIGADPDVDIYAAGPPAMVDACEREALLAGVARDRILLDRYTPASDGGPAPFGQ